MTTINIENATHANHHSYTDITPYEIVRKVSEKTIEVRRMKSTIINADKLEFHLGGFCANCSNQNIQEYNYESDESEYIEKVRLNKKGEWRDKYGLLYILSDKPKRFYDYNF